MRYYDMNKITEYVEEYSYESVCEVMGLIPPSFPGLRLIGTPVMDFINGNYKISAVIKSEARVDSPLKEQVKSFILSELKLREIYTKIGATLSIGITLKSDYRCKSIYIIKII
jgi:hypothetical protein